MRIWVVATLLLLIIGLSGCTNASTYHSNPDVASCYKLPDDSYHIEHCLGLLFQNNTDPALCSDITDKTYQSNGQTVVDTYRTDLCYSDIANNTKDAQFCNQVKDSSRKELCQSAVSLQMGLVRGCDTITGSDRTQEKIRNECYHTQAVAQSSVSLCDKVTDTAGLLNAREVCIVDVAKKLDNESICGLATNSNPNVNSVDRWGCYTYFAKEKNDITICDELPPANIAFKTLTDRDACMMQVIDKLGDVTKCPTLSSVLAKDRCYYAFAKKGKDISLCDNIAENDRKILCKADVSNDGTQCDLISQDSKDVCYITVAMGKPDQQLCSKISDSVLKSMCNLHFIAS